MGSQYSKEDHSEVQNKQNRGTATSQEQDLEKMRAELYAGLSAHPAVVSPKFLYDALGSKLFEAICELPEYYLTRTEKLIFDKYAVDIAKVTGTDTTLIDLGAGNCQKAARLFPFLQPSQYVPIDISVEFLNDAVLKIRQQYPYLDVLALGMDFSSKITLPVDVHEKKRLFFWPGSSISNFSPEQALQFLRGMHALCAQDGREDGGILISVDLVKDKDVLDAAYDDAWGLTALFNLNLLHRLNREFGMNFHVKNWQHVGYFNVPKSRVEMHLQATSPQTVKWSEGERHFKARESIHTESSYKFTRASFEELLKKAGFTNLKTWTDPQDWFMVCYARATKF